MPSVIALLALAFLVIPIAELALIVKVSSSIGVLDTLALLIVVSVIGAWLVKREGLGVWRRLNDTLARGQVPSTEVVDGLMILMAGAFMLTPGFLTDAFGLALLVPPVRAAIRAVVGRRLQARVHMGPITLGRSAYQGFGHPFEPRGDDRPPGGVHDTTGTEMPRAPGPDDSGAGDGPPDLPPAR